MPLLQATLYHRDGRQIIDWVRHPDEDTWYSMNHTAVGATGVDFAFSYQPDLPLHPAAGGNYSYCYIDRDHGNMISGYALEYLRHKATLYLAFSPIQNLRLKADAIYRYREGKYTDSNGNICTYGGALLLNMAVEYSLKGSLIQCFIEAHNLLNTSYRDHGGVPQPGRTFMAGVKINTTQNQQ